MARELSTEAHLYAMCEDADPCIRGIVAAEDWIYPKAVPRRRCGFRLNGQWWVFESWLDDIDPVQIDDLEMSLDVALGSVSLVPIDRSIATQLLAIWDDGYDIPLGFLDLLRLDPATGPEGMNDRVENELDPWLGFQVDDGILTGLCEIHPDSTAEFLLARWYDEGMWVTANPSPTWVGMRDLVIVDPQWRMPLQQIHSRPIAPVIVDILRRYRHDDSILSAEVGRDTYLAIQRLWSQFADRPRKGVDARQSERLAEWLDDLHRMRGRELVATLAMVCEAIADDPQSDYATEAIVHDLIEALIGRGIDTVHALHWVHAIKQPGEKVFTVLEHGFRADDGWDDDMPFDDPRWDAEQQRLDANPALVQQLCEELGWEESDGDPWFMSDTIKLDRISASKVVELFDDGVPLTRGLMEWCSKPGHDVVASASVSPQMLATVAQLIAETGALPQSPPERDALIEWLTKDEQTPFSAMAWNLLTLTQTRHELEKGERP